MNNQLVSVPSKLLQNKLSKLVTRLQSVSNAYGVNTDLKTLESVIAESIKALSQFYSSLNTPSFSPVPVVPDTVPDAVAYNKTFSDIDDDLQVIFEEFENLEQVVVGEFNYMVSKLNLLSRIMKSVYSQLGDYVLFSQLPTRDAQFFSDSFNNLSRVEANSPLLNSDQCEVNQVEGIVTLPIDRKQQKLITVTSMPVINSNSNGRNGNQEELNARLHGDIKDILDNNADTWFEYERVVLADDATALILDITINLDQPQVINFIRINPNNFGTRTQVEIVAIDTSIDGQQFVSVKDDIPIPGFITIDEANIFTLAPSTSKYAGQGFYTFTPRKAKYVHLTLKQSTPYVITTSAGVKKVRYAIGIRDVDIQALPYKNKGEIISTNYLSSDDIRKIALVVGQSPDPSTVSQLASIKHYLSPDNGITWHQIRPLVSSGSANVDQTVPEILNFNTVDSDAIKTASSVQSVRYKALLERNTSAFSDSSSDLAQVIAKSTELHSPPTTTPFSITLQHLPVTNTIKLIDPQFGSRGKENIKYNIAVGRNAALNVLLPFKPLKRDLVKTYSIDRYFLEDLAPEKIYVDGNLWSSGLSASSSDTAEVYRVNYEEGRLVTGDGTHGKLIPVGSRVAMTLNEERLFPTQDTKHTALLDYPTSTDKDQMEVYYVEPPTVCTLVLKKNAKRHVLKPDIKDNSGVYTFRFSDETVFAPGGEVDFVDGSTELTTGKYSIDYTNGVLYSYGPTAADTDTTVTFFYIPRTRLSASEWDFVNSGTGVTNAISIKDDAYKTHKSEWENVPLGVKYFNLGQLAVVRGSLEFSGTGGITTIPELSVEVPFVDGHSELLGVIVTTEAVDPITGVTPGDVKAISFKTKISTDTSFAVTFSNQTIFATEKASYGDIATAGDYYIDRAAGVFYVKLDDNVSSPGTVSYYYTNPQAILTGRFSVNYDTGEVFSYGATPVSVIVRYEYTDYRARYNIARLISNTNWTFDTTTKKITIKDSEILRSLQIPQETGQSTNTKYYQVVYDYVQSTRVDVNDLEAFFSPILKDYALKVITRSHLI